MWGALQIGFWSRTLATALKPDHPPRFSHLEHQHRGVIASAGKVTIQRGGDEAGSRSTKP